MSEKRYRYVGRVAAPFTVLEGRVIGDEFDADLDKNTHDLLVGAGALLELPKPRKEAAKSESKPAAKTEAKSEAKES